VEEPRYSKGELVFLNDFGQLVIQCEMKVGIIISEPYSKFFPPNALEGIALEYWTYDVLFGTELISLVPEEFLARMIKNDDEENT
jgi:hypothetical protein